MTSPLLAHFTRSVREDTRAKSTYWARACLAAFMLMVMGMAALSDVTSGAPGLDFLQTVAWLHLIFLTISGVGWFASAITEEKEEETLDLLCMTNLSPLSILLGKSTSRLCGALLLVVAQLPFTLLAVTLGGVSRGQVFAVYATLAAYTFFLCNLALLASVLAYRTGIASLLTAAALFAAWVAGNFVPGIAAMSPFGRLLAIFATGFAARPIGFQVVSNFVAGGVLFGVAWAVFRRFCETPSRGELPLATTRRHGWFSPGRPKVGAVVESPSSTEV